MFYRQFVKDGLQCYIHGSSVFDGGFCFRKLNLPSLTELF
jgi:hypothetical protein